MVIRKRFGQHFLEPAWVVKLMRTVAPEANQTFLEIGPGRGALTRPLVARAANVVAFEIDRDLAAALRSEDIAKLTIVEGDFLDVTADAVRAALPEGHTRLRRCTDRGRRAVSQGRTGNPGHAHQRHRDHPQVGAP